MEKKGAQSLLAQSTNQHAAHVHLFTATQSRRCIQREQTPALGGNLRLTGVLCKVGLFHPRLLALLFDQHSRALLFAGFTSVPSVNLRKP